MTKRQKQNWQRERELQNAGWQVDTAVLRANDGSESLKHFLLKAVVAKVLRDRGLQFTMECVHDDRGEVDVLCHGPPDGKAYAIECERNISEETVSSKLERYVHGPIRECFILPVDDAPDRFEEAYAWVSGKLF